MIQSVRVAAWDDERVWPNFSETAEMLRVDRSTLTKQARHGRVYCVRRGMGRGERLVPIAEVVRLASIYRRIPVDDVLTHFADRLAARLTLDATDILHCLQCLAETTRSSTLTAQEAPSSDGRGWTGENVGADQRAKPPAPGEPGTGPAVVRMGRLRPQAMSADEFPAPGLLEALESRRPSEPHIRRIEPEPRAVQRGRLRPGTRA